MTATVLAEGDLRVVDHGRRRDLVLTRPQARNAVSPSMLSAMRASVLQAQDDGVLVLVLRGEGVGFCAGADIGFYAGAGSEDVAQFTRSALAVCDSLESFEGVVVVGVHGVCVGGGFELALASDLLVVTEDARLGLPELRLGLIPGWGGTQRLTRLAGPAVARSLVLGSRTISGVRAYELGLAHAVVTEAELDTTLDELADSLERGPAVAIRAAKRAIAAADWSSESGTRLETALLLELFASPDGREGVRAFVEKRPATFGQGEGS